MRKLEGHFNGIPVYTDTECPPGMLYFINENYANANAIIDMRTKRQKLWAKIKSIAKRAMLCYTGIVTK